METEAVSSTICSGEKEVPPNEQCRFQSEALPKPSTPTRKEGDGATSSLAPTSFASPTTSSTPHTSSHPSVPPSTLEGARASLLPGRELSTTAMSLILRLLRNPAVCDYDAGWYDSSRPITHPRAAGKATTLLLPIHRAGHWNLAVLEPQRKVVKCFDSLGGMDKRLIADLKRDLESFKWEGGTEEGLGQWRVEPQTTPQQSNAVDCGVFVLATAMCVVVDVNIPRQIDAVVWRYVFRSVVDVTAEGSFLGDYTRYGNGQGGLLLPISEAEDICGCPVDAIVISADLIVEDLSRTSPNSSAVDFPPLTGRMDEDIKLLRESANHWTSQFELVRARAERVKDEICLIRGILERLCTRLARPPMQQLNRLQAGLTATRYE